MKEKIIDLIFALMGILSCITIPTILILACLTNEYNVGRVEKVFSCWEQSGPSRAIWCDVLIDGKRFTVSGTCVKGTCVWARCDYMCPNCCVVISGDYFGKSCNSINRLKLFSSR